MSYIGRQIKKQFVLYWHFTGWDCISLGVHVCLSLPNFEIHLPFGFIRVGMFSNYVVSKEKREDCKY